jgi:hypothetical protein
MRFALRGGLVGMADERSRAVASDVRGVPATLASVDRLARLQLDARRSGIERRLRNVSPELDELVCLCGLRRALRLDAGGQAEQREEGVDLEEERQVDDPAG